MKIQSLWYLVCWVFGFHSLDTLVEESREVVYEKLNQTEKEPVQFLACKELSWLNRNQTIDLQKLRDRLYRRFESSIQIDDDDEEKDYLGDSREFKKLIFNQIKSRGYLILNAMICLIANDKWELFGILKFLSREAVLLAINRNTLDFVKIYDDKDKIDQLVVLNKAHPYSNCDQSNSRFRCLNECFKRSFRLARYFYNNSETGLIHLKPMNWSVERSERNCFEECKKEDCKMVQLISNDETKKTNSATFKSQPKLSEFDYWLQLIGLVCSFAGLSFHELTSIAIEFTASKVRRRKVRIALVGLKWTILFLALTSFGYLCTRTFLDYNAKEEAEKGTTRNLIRPKIVRLAVCVEIDKYVNHKYEDKTMSEIEKATDGALNDLLKDIYVNYQGRSFRTNYQVQPKVLFKRIVEKYHQNNYRCFLLSIRPNYRMIHLNPKLKIKFKGNIFPFLYILSEDENLNGKSFKYSGDFAFKKNIAKRLRSGGGRCMDYAEKYGNCTGRWNCVERCIGRKFMERHKRTTFGIDDDEDPMGINEDFLVIDRDWFILPEWNTSKLMEISLHDKYKVGIYNNISEECLKEIRDEKPCDETKFEETVKITHEWFEKEIDLQFDVERSVEESASWYKLALDLVSIQGIFFGLTALGSLQTVGCFIRTRLKASENKTVLFLIYLLCSIGGIWHTYHIFHLVVSGELVATRYYRLAEKIPMPEMVFCSQIDMKIDRNHKLTGNYLEKLTRESTAKRMFRHISYLNGSNEWISVNPKLLERFFLLNMKCFRFKIDQAYERNQFFFSSGRQVLKVDFNKKRNEWQKQIYFMTKSEETGGFSKFVSLKYEWKLYSSSWEPGHSITHETSFYEYQDRFSFIRRHFLTFQQEDSDINMQLLELQGNEHNLRTLNLPLEEDAFLMEVNEDLFEQLYSVQNQKRNRQLSLNYRQLFVTNHLNENEMLKGFGLNLDFLQKIVSSTNEENLGQLILSLLNVLSIWFDLGVLDLHPIFVLSHDYLLVYLYLHLPIFLFFKITQLLLLSCKWLKKLESPLYELLQPRKSELTKSSPN